MNEKKEQEKNLDNFIAWNVISIYFHYKKLMVLSIINI